MEYRRLGKTGMEVSVIGYGVSPVGNVFGETDEAEATRAIHCAIDNGVNFFDVSPYYGRTLAETRLGEALKGKRDAVLLATKCGRYGDAPDEFDFSARRVTASMDESLQRLQTDHVDLFQAHDVQFVDDPDRIVGETIPALEKLRDKGKTRRIGITGYPLKILRYIASRTAVDTILSFCRYNLMITDMNEVLRPFCQERGIGLINASPLHMRILTAKGAPDWHQAPQEVKDVARRLVGICEEAGASLPDVAIRFCLDYPHVATTLIGMSKVRHVEANLRLLGFRSEPDLLARLQREIEPVKDMTWIDGRRENNDDFFERE